GGRLTVLFTDIAGFTACVAERGDQAALRLVRQHDIAVLPAIRSHSGRILKRLGDGVMAVFSTPAAALRAALEMQRAARRVSLRIGIHAGPARSRDGDLIGHDVTVAAPTGARARASAGGAAACAPARAIFPYAFAPPLRTCSRGPPRTGSFASMRRGAGLGQPNDDTGRLGRQWRKNDIRSGGVSVSHRQDH